MGHSTVWGASLITLNECDALCCVTFLEKCTRVRRMSKTLKAQLLRLDLLTLLFSPFLWFTWIFEFPYINNHSIFEFPCDSFDLWLVFRCALYEHTKGQYDNGWNLRGSSPQNICIAIHPFRLFLVQVTEFYIDISLLLITVEVD